MKPIIVHTHHVKSSPWLNNVVHKRPGRPRVIPKSLEPEIIKMYREQALGYRKIKRELKRIGIEVSWQTIRRLIKDRLDENLEYRLTHCTGRRSKRALQLCRSQMIRPCNRIRTCNFRCINNSNNCIIVHHSDPRFTHANKLMN